MAPLGTTSTAPSTTTGTWTAAPPSDGGAHTVIVGSGIIGLSAAYFLCESGHTAPASICLLDSSAELFQCASGLAGGFCAKDWFAPSVAALGALSFDLHAQLAERHGGRDAWGYAPSTAVSLAHDCESAVAGSGEDWLHGGAGDDDDDDDDAGARPAWLRGADAATSEVISREGTTAQLDPRRFCAWLRASVERRGVRLLQPATATGVLRDARGVLGGVRVQRSDGRPALDVPCSRLLIAAGAWSPRVFAALFPGAPTRIPVSSLAGHSLLVRNPLFDPRARAPEACHAVFATDTLGFAPEWFARLGGELYLAGLNTTGVPLPDVATDAVASPKAIEQLTSCARAMMVDGAAVEVLRQGLCFRPVTPSGRPLVARIPDEKLGGIQTRGGGQGGVFVAAGHGAWGISHAPGTGLVLAEMLEGRPTSVSVDALRLPS